MARQARRTCLSWAEMCPCVTNAAKGFDCKLRETCRRWCGADGPRDSRCIASSRPHDEPHIRHRLSRRRRGEGTPQHTRHCLPQQADRDPGVPRAADEGRLGVSGRARRSGSGPLAPRHESLSTAAVTGADGTVPQTVRMSRRGVVTDSSADCRLPDRPTSGSLLRAPGTASPAQQTPVEQRSGSGQRGAAVDT